MLKRNRVSMMICLAFCAVLLAGCGQPKNFKLKDPTLEVVSPKVAEAILTDAGTDEDAVQSLRDNYDSSTQQLVQYTCYVIPEDLPETWVAFGFIAVTTRGENPTFQYVSKPYGKMDDSPENYKFDAAAPFSWSATARWKNTKMSPTWTTQIMHRRRAPLPTSASWST